MTTVKSLEDLDRIRAQALQKSQRADMEDPILIIVGIDTPAIAAGGQATLQAIRGFIEIHNLQNVLVRQTGNLGMDSSEPIIQVKVGDQPKVTYGNVDPAAANRILQEHVLGGQIVQDYVIESA